jgi:hypothetical protein
MNMQWLGAVVSVTGGAVTAVVVVVGKPVALLWAAQEARMAASTTPNLTGDLVRILTSSVALMMQSGHALQGTEHKWGQASTNSQKYS